MIRCSLKAFLSIKKSIKTWRSGLERVMQCIFAIVSYRKIDMILDERYSLCNILWLYMILTVKIVLLIQRFRWLPFNTLHFFIFIVVISFWMAQIDPYNHQHWWISNAKFLRRGIQHTVNQQLKLSARNVSKLLYLLITRHRAFELSSNNSDC